MIQMMGQDETEVIANHKYICNHFLVVHLARQWPQIGLTGSEFRLAIENTVSGVASNIATRSWGARRLGQASRTQRKPMLPVELSDVLRVRAATRYRWQ
jgi:hypothetical protein